MGLYQFLHRCRLPGGYAGKFFLVAFVGVHLPLLAGLAWSHRNDAVDWTMLGVLLAATLTGTAVTFLGLHALLAPIRAAAGGLEAYARDATLPRLPTTQRDLAGRLMARTQETLAGLDTALTAARTLQGTEAAHIQRRETALAEVTHELRSPLTAVLGFAELLEMQSHGPLGHPRYAEFAADIAASGQHMLALVEDVQRYAVATGARSTIERSPQRIAVLANRAARLLRGEEEARGVTIRIDIVSDATVAADGRALLQSLLNLIGNAVKYAGKGATVLVTLEHDGADDVIVVRDDGVGMTAEELRLALEPFGRSPAARASGIGGTGLGLPLVQALAEAHGGRLAVTSTPGRGTTARLLLPRGATGRTAGSPEGREAEEARRSTAA